MEKRLSNASIKLVCIYMCVYVRSFIVCDAFPIPNEDYSMGTLSYSRNI